jgi:glutamine transport system permease protein
MSLDWQAAFAAIPLLLEGLKLTVFIAAVGLFGGIAAGTVAGVALTYGNWISRLIAQSYVAVIRGTPIVVQVMFVYFALPILLNLRIGANEAAIITIIINSGAYNAEIVRGALQGVPRGLVEAALSMGLPFRSALAFVVAPIAYRLALPAMGNQVVNVIKDTSIFLVIGVGELTRRGQEIMAENFRAVEIWMTVAALYFVLITTVAYAVRLYERKARLP